MGHLGWVLCLVLCSCSSPCYLYTLNNDTGSKTLTNWYTNNLTWRCNNYRPISLLPCISKVFEKLVFNHIYTYLTGNKLISPYQLVSICHNISQALDNGDEIMSVFLDFKKAFDKVWHKGLIFKLEKIGISGSLVKWLILQTTMCRYSRSKINLPTYICWNSTGFSIGSSAIPDIY